MRLLLVEDDLGLAAALVRGLRDAAYAVDRATDGEAALELAAVNDYDAVVLDVMLPLRDGFDVCRALRARGAALPILMLSARDEVADRVTGLDAGADDYLPKPFSFAELLARLRALLRRGSVILPEEIRVADLVIDTRRQQARRGNRDILLTAKEYAFLELLARNVGTVVSRTEICAHVWDDNHDPASNAIEVYVNRLRHKIDHGATRPLIHTRRGAGYVLAASVPTESQAGRA